LANQLLEVQDLGVAYGDVQALWDISLEVSEGSIVALVGANGAGKTTLLETISGLQDPGRGRVLFQGEDVCSLSPKDRVAKGILYVPEGRRLFAGLTVLENLRLGAYLRSVRPRTAKTVERVFSLFPILAERKDYKAGLLSGGEQQMLAIGRALMGHPRLLMLDEVSLGLSPILVRTIFELIKQLNEQDATTILLVEQNIHMALKVADYAYVVQTGHVVMSGTGEELLENEDVRKAYIGQRGSKLL
jgi:branched-chain amino acid transport system ATP-binding protein